MGDVILEEYFHIVDDICFGNFEIYLGSKFFLDYGVIIDHNKFKVSCKKFSCRMFIDEVGFKHTAILDEISVAVASVGYPQRENNFGVKFNDFEFDTAINCFNLGHLQRDEIYQIATILNSYEDVFQDLMAENLPDLLFDSLKLTTDKYIQAAIYRTPQIHKQLIEDEMKRLLDLKIISHSKSPFNSPVWIVPKKSGVDGE